MLETLRALAEPNRFQIVELLRKGPRPVGEMVDRLGLQQPQVSNLVASLQHEVRLLLHLASKVDPAKVDYRPTPKQRSVLELMQHLTIMPPIHLRTIKAGRFELDAWRGMWRAAEAAAKGRTLEQTKAAIAKQSALLADLVGSCSDADLRAEIEIFGQKASRGSWLVSLVLCHYAAYRMQLFLYLKACGREENLWTGMDAVAA
jgi:DNA-binding HxlR family transcriptional regulator